MRWYKPVQNHWNGRSSGKARKSQQLRRKRHNLYMGAKTIVKKKVQFCIVELWHLILEYILK